MQATANSRKTSSASTPFNGIALSASPSDLLLDSLAESEPSHRATTAELEVISKAPDKRVTVAKVTSTSGPKQRPKVSGSSGAESKGRFRTGDKKKLTFDFTGVRSWQHSSELWMQIRAGSTTASAAKDSHR